MSENGVVDSKVYGQDRVGWLKKRSKGLFPRWQRRFARLSEDFLVLLHNPSSSYARRYKICGAHSLKEADIVVSTAVHFLLTVATVLYVLVLVT
jgi:hypothetical protein